MRVILYYDVLLVSLDASHNLAQRLGTTYACHILQTYLVSTSFDECLGKVYVILHRVYWRMSNTKRSLCYHASILSVLYRRNHITWVIESAEYTGDVSTLSLLYLVEEFAQVLRTRAHAQSVQRTVQHVCLNASLVERLRPLANCLIRIFTIKQVNLLKTTTVSLHAVKASHLYYRRSNLYKLVHTWLILTSTLPHITKDQTELNFFCHLSLFCFF